MKDRLPIHILLAESNPSFGPFLKNFLITKGYPTHLCTEGEQALAAYDQQLYNFIICDTGTPKMDGFKFVQAIREENEQIPILFLSTKNLTEERIKGFKMGCDDYISKPFCVDELLVRIDAIWRRLQTESRPNVNTYHISKFTFDCENQNISTRQSTQHLTVKEAELLKLLCRNVNMIVPRKKALLQIWHSDSIFNARSMDVYITRLRKYLKSDKRINIKNIHGIGFKLNVSNSAPIS